MKSSQLQVMHLEGLHALVAAGSGVQGEAFAGPHSTGAAFPLQRIGLAHPILHQQTQPAACIVPPLLQGKVA